MDANNRAMLWLDQFNLTYRKREQMLKLAGDAGQLYAGFKSLRAQLIQIAGEDWFSKMSAVLDDKLVDKIIEDLYKKDINIITIYDEQYPDKLRNTDSPPLVLYYRGDIGLLKSKCFAVVGTRHITNYGKTVTELFSRDLCKAGFTIVSGLTVGVDSIAHNTTLANNGKTISVLPCGFDKIYPASNFGLSKQIEEKGLVVSEFRPDAKTERYFFAIRNRIIAGLSMGVLITEAGEKSGAMHTKNYAIDNNTEVFAVPGNITSEASKGCNRLIANSQAVPVTNIKDILNVYNIQLKMELPKAPELLPEQKSVYNLLKNESLTFQQIIQKTGMDTKNLNSLLTTMQISGIISKSAGNVYSV